MIAVRKVQQVNRSLVIVIPQKEASAIDVVKGDYVTIKRLRFGEENAVLIRKLDTKKLSEEKHYDRH